MSLRLIERFRNDLGYFAEKPSRRGCQVENDDGTFEFVHGIDQQMPRNIVLMSVRWMTPWTEIISSIILLLFTFMKI